MENMNHIIFYSKDNRKLIERDDAEARKKMRDVNDVFRFQLPFLPMIYKKYGLTWGWK